jgi:hypothetical protein
VNNLGTHRIEVDPLRGPPTRSPRPFARQTRRPKPSEARDVGRWESAFAAMRGFGATPRHSSRCILRERRRVAGSTGLEPAASGVTGRRSNQLNYDPDRDLCSAFALRWTTIA